MDSVTNTTSIFAGSASPNECRVCHKNFEKVLKCSQCRVAIYCSNECQKKDWQDHKVECLTAKEYSKENESVRENFSGFDALVLKLPHPKFKSETYNHVLQTRGQILRGSDHLNRETSTVVVCGAQFFDDKFVEPLPELLEKCKKMILLDVDPATLEKLHQMLGSSAKVSTMVMDFTFALKDLPAFYKESSKSSPQQFLFNMCNFLAKVTLKTGNREPGLSVESADYVISSLVGSQLALCLKKNILSHFAKKFGQSHNAYMGPLLENRSGEELTKCVHALVIKHVEDLCATAGQEGRIYFADSYQSNNGTLLPEPTIINFTQTLCNRSKGLQIAKWNNLANQNNDYSIISILS
jgi:hypothetical protein